jgi:hypothetical protein
VTNDDPPTLAVNVDTIKPGTYVITHILESNLSDNTLIFMNGTGISVSSEMKIRINSLPKDGTCTISPTNGVTNITPLTITPIDWVDIEDSTSLTYKFTYLKEGETEEVEITENPFKAPSVTVLTNFDFFCYISDTEGGITKITVALAIPIRLEV